MIALLLGMVTTSDCQQRNPDTDNMLSENLCLEELLCFVGLYMCAGSSEGTHKPVWCCRWLRQCF